MTINFKLGSDPEFLCFNDKGPVSCHEFIPGTKDKPEPLPNGGSILCDGVALEINPPVASTASEFAEATLSTLSDAKELLPKGVYISKYSMTQFNHAYWDKLPAEVKQVGCDPAFINNTNNICLETIRDTYIKKPDTFHARYDIVKLHKERRRAWTGGHLHIGFKESPPECEQSHFVDCALIARLMVDLRYRLPCLPSRGTLKDITHRGDIVHSSEFRPKVYGIELRSPDAGWCFMDKNRLKSMFDGIKIGFENAVTTMNVNCLSNFLQDTTDD